MIILYPLYPLGQAVYAQNSEPPRKQTLSTWATKFTNEKQILENPDSDFSVRNQALSVARRAAENSDPEAMTILGGDYFRQGDLEEATYWFKSAAKLGYAVGMVGAATVSMIRYVVDDADDPGSSKAKEDLAETYGWGRKAFDAGLLEAGAILGVLYAEGLGVQQDYSEAMRYFRAASETINGTAAGAAMTGIGDLYQGGRGVRRDVVEAMRWYRKGAEAGDSDAMDSIGSLYESGGDVTQDYREAMRWYMKAAESGDDKAVKNVGKLFAGGHCTQREYAEVRAWATAAKAAARDIPAMKELAYLYANGETLSQNLRGAVWWYQKAADKGNELAKDELERVKHMLANRKFLVQTNPADGLSYVFVPPGIFVMGCSPGDKKCSDDEKPAHRVTITAGFWIGQTSVPREVYERLGSGGPHPSRFSLTPPPAADNTSPGKLTSPWASSVWSTAAEYCSAIGMRLPSEAEWEYAFRFIGGSDEALFQTSPLASNWTADWYGASYYGTSPEQDPGGPSNGEYRGVRGEGAPHRSSALPIAERGFRCAGGLPPRQSTWDAVGLKQSIPAGTQLAVRLLDPIDVRKDRPNTTYSAVLDQDVYLVGSPIVRAGIAVTPKLVLQVDEDEHLALVLERMTIGPQGRSVQANGAHEALAGDKFDRGALLIFTLRSDLAISP